MFRSEDYLRSEVAKVENGTPLSGNIDAFAAEINDFLKKISGSSADDAKSSEEPAAPAQSQTGQSVAAQSLPDDKDAVCFIHIFPGGGRRHGKPSGLHDRQRPQGMRG